jgi:hypothetical protein
MKNLRENIYVFIHTHTHTHKIKIKNSTKKLRQYASWGYFPYLIIRECWNFNGMMVVDRKELWLQHLCRKFKELHLGLPSQSNLYLKLFLVTQKSTTKVHFKIFTVQVTQASTVPGQPSRLNKQT